jgi:hypothetical protein
LRERLFLKDIRESPLEGVSDRVSNPRCCSIEKITADNERDR